MKAQALILFLGILLWGGADGRAEPAATQHVTYYYITGDSTRSLRASINAKKPKHIPHDALTVWNVGWTYSWQPIGGGVEIRAPVVTVSISSTLPRWTPPSDADERLVERWRNYMQALVKHENGHAAIGIQAAREIEKQLAILPRQPSADVLKQLVETTCQKILKEAKERERKFDEQTQHGMKQGARFP